MKFDKKLTVPRQILTMMLAIILASLFVPVGVHADPDTAAHQLFLPLVSKADVATASNPSCQLNEQEKRLEELLRNHADQQRPTLTCNPILAAVARAHAEEMGRRAYFNHTNPDGYGPNYFVRQAGYVLPSGYSQENNGNNIESIGAGPNNADGMWDAWMNSDKHTTHLLATGSFFVDQTDYGIGFAQVPGSPYQFYWVFISARPGP
jgi:uncharacterized protein YkwD